MDRDEIVIERPPELVDELTGVFNTSGFRFLGEQHLALARRLVDPVTAVFVEVAGLAHLVSTRGRNVGDEALGEVARLMLSTFRATDVVGRLGENEFGAVLLNDGTAPSVAAGRLRMALDLRNSSGLRPFPLNCYIGAIRHRPDDDSNVEELMRQAQSARFQPA